MADQTLDCKGLNCPLPILKAKKALNSMDVGQTLEVVSTDIGSIKDFEAFCAQTGNTLESMSEAGGEYIYVIKKV